MLMSLPGGSRLGVNADLLRSIDQPADGPRGCHSKIANVLVCSESSVELFLHLSSCLDDGLEPDELSRCGVAIVW